MNEIRYNQASTFSQVLIAGMFATQLLPAIPQRNVAESSSKNFSRAVYRTSSNGASYSYYGSPITGEYSNVIETQDRSWMTPELAQFLRDSSQVSLGALDHLLVAIRDAYGEVQVNVAMHTDPEEGWIKPVITVRSGIDDFDKLLEIEDGFFSKAATDSTLLATLPFVVVSLS